ncbi:MAG: GatB/YqeY domain-containing protein [Coriobacteriales bacterium]|jgi:uncharacterized protein YqeY|nr:GatB/YqeY domain-containing protein [Coriobacteriales bacterium]
MDYQKLLDDIKAAMKAQDKPRLAILRQWHTEVKNIEVDERRSVTSEDVTAMLRRLLKQTRETLDGSIRANNDQQRTETLTTQVSILESYLPRQVQGDELDALIGQVLAGLGTTAKKDMGKVMGALSAKTGGNFDKPEAAAILSTRLTDN